MIPIRIPIILPAAIGVAAWLFVFWPVLFGDKIYFYARSHAVLHPASPLPAGGAARRFRVPLWNPWILCGTPFFGNPQALAALSVERAFERSFGGACGGNLRGVALPLGDARHRPILTSARRRRVGARRSGRWRLAWAARSSASASFRTWFRPQAGCRGFSGESRGCWSITPLPPIIGNPLPRRLPRYRGQGGVIRSRFVSGSPRSRRTHK